MERITKETKQKHLLDPETAFEVLKREFLSETSMINLDEADIRILLQGSERVYFWKSPLAVSGEDADAMARQAAAELKPELGRKLQTALLKIIGDNDTGLEDFERIFMPIQQQIPGDAGIIFGAEFCPEQTGIRFLLAVSEGD